jgi:hypothetical protein
MLTAQLTAENAVGTKRSFSVRTGVVQFKGGPASSFAVMMRLATPAPSEQS